MDLGAGLRQRNSPAVKPGTSAARNPFVKSATVAGQPNTDSLNSSSPSLQRQNSLPADSSEEGMFIPPG